MDSDVLRLVIASSNVALVLIALAVLLLRDRRRPRRAAETLVARSVALQLDDGSAVVGVLVKRAGEFYVVENAKLHEHGTAVDVDGAAWIPAQRIRWVQVTPWTEVER